MRRQSPSVRLAVAWPKIVGFHPPPTADRPINPKAFFKLSLLGCR
jgi:hypothetical protein